MDNRLNISRKDLQHMINEVCRKLSYLNESVKEGGAAGHMYHPYDIDEFTFGDYKELINQLFSTGIEDASEKLDGMNIFATVDPNGIPRFARSKKQIETDGGMGEREMEERWQGEDKAAILMAYKHAFYIFGQAISKLRNPVEFFNPQGYRLYANCEVIDSLKPNDIQYKENSLSFHGLVPFDEAGNKAEFPEDELERRMNVLKQILPGVETEYGKAQVTPGVVIKIREDNYETMKNFISEIDQIESECGANDSTTLIKYRETKLIEWLNDNGYEIIAQNPFSERFLRRWIYGEKTPTVVQLKKEMLASGNQDALKIYNISYDFEKSGKLKEVMKMIMEPIENFTYRLGNEVINRCQGYTNEGDEARVIDNLVAHLEAVKEEVAGSGDIGLQEEFAYWLGRLAQLDYKYNAMEGVVFNYKGKTLKLTGSFAALNRALNIKMNRGK